MDKNVDLSGLKDIHLPDLPSVWPWAYGWWIVIIVGILFLIGLWFLFKKYKKQRMKLKLFALKEVDTLVEKFRNDQNILASELSLLLRRLVLLKFPRDQVAILHGKKWRFYLEKTLKKSFFQRKKKNPFEGQAGLIVEKVLYTPKKHFKVDSAEPLVNALKEWINKHT